MCFASPLFQNWVTFLLSLQKKPRIQPHIPNALGGSTSSKTSPSVLLNVSGEATTKALWDELGTLYQSKSLVNKLFLRKKLYNLRMKDGDSVTKHMNAFNTVVSQLSSVDIKISNEDKCISFLCSLPIRGIVWLLQ